MGGQTSVRDRRARSLDARYELRDPIGAGGMASVWLATDTRLDREVAVKFLSEQFAEDPDFVARFRREARVAASLQHPNLVAVYDFDADAHPPYLVMEHVAGPNLSQRLAEGEPVDVARMATGLIEALGAIHARGIVHRDVKPHNVLLTEGGDAKLGDFGIARPRESTSITQTGQVLGTARYMAPEVLEGGPAGPASDLYSCGVVLSECVAKSGSAPARVARLAGRMAAADPADRPGSAAEALAELEGRGPVVPAPAPAEEAAAKTAVLAPTPPPPERPSAAGERFGSPEGPDRSRLVAISGLALVALIALLVIVTSGGGDDVPTREQLRAEGLRPANESDGAGAKGAQAQGEGQGQPDPAGPAAAGGGGSSDADEADIGEGAALNDEGFALTQSGDYDRAVEVLRRAVDAFPEGTSDLNYAYALYNLGHALRLGGDPEAAIPVLEERLRIPNQTDVVRRELEAARAAAD